MKIFVIKSNASSKKILKKAQESFRTEKPPSKQVIINRGIDIQNGYDFTLILVGISLVFTAIFNNGF